jgi:hypothetical protein
MRPRSEQRGLATRCRIEDFYFVSLRLWDAYVNVRQRILTFRFTTGLLLTLIL